MDPSNATESSYINNQNIVHNMHNAASYWKAWIISYL